MNQPQNPNPPRGARPQLFNAPEGKKPHSSARGHADFGPSILATIDGGQSRIARSRDRSPFNRVLLLAVLALVAAAVYVGLKFSTARASAAQQVVAAAPAEMPVAAKPAEVAVPAVSQADLQGAAAIETVATVAETASAPTPASDQAASINSLQQTLDRSEPAPVKKEKAVSKSAQPTRTASSTTRSPKPGAKKAATQADTDADLLAAMLPHIARGPGAPTSPAFERRCGQLTGAAAVVCKTKFCNGREGVDAACPAPAQSL
jgi:hypothetical protein